MYQLINDDRIIVKLDIPLLIFPDSFNIPHSVILEEVFSSINRLLFYNNSDIDRFYDILIETLSDRLLEYSSWDIESDSYEREEAEKTMISINFVETNKSTLYSFIQRVNEVYQILKLGLMEINRTISRISYYPVNQHELILEVLYERCFSAI